jgi:2-dehydro-3-deoxyphosphogluconate aldolase/(4S)-4-hydroxy-2-oxoglutarate aldolase
MLVADGSRETYPLLNIVAAERLLAVVVLDDPAATESLGTALLRSGLRCIEVTLRTESAVDAIAAMAANGERVVGAGTVQERGVPVFPGVATATEIQRALAAGATTLSCFPRACSMGRPW